MIAEVFVRNVAAAYYSCAIVRNQHLVVHAVVEAPELGRNVRDQCATLGGIRDIGSERRRTCAGALEVSAVQNELGDVVEEIDAEYDGEVGTFGCRTEWLIAGVDAIRIQLG